MRLILWLAILLAGALRPPHGTIVVHEGGSIRAAMARASAGDRVEVLPGTYREGEEGDLNALTSRAGASAGGKAKGKGGRRPPEQKRAELRILGEPGKLRRTGKQDDPEHPACGGPDSR